MLILVFSVLSAPPPPPPCLMSANKPSGDVAPMAPPPPPPTLSFVPPQIRNWTPPPPSPRPPMAMNRPFLGPPRHFAPGPYHPGPNAGPYPPGPSQMPGMPPHMAPPGGLMVPVTTQQDHVIDKPKVVYSAAPVRLHPKKGKVKKPKTAVPAVSTVTEVVSEIKADVIDRGLAGVAVPTGPVTTEEECDLMEADEAVGGKKAKKDKKKKFIRTAAGETWEDASLEEWETGNYT